MHERRGMGSMRAVTQIDKQQSKFTESYLG